MKEEHKLLPEGATYFAGSYGTVVIGGGHAGCEAALSSARLGIATVIFTINLDSVANMPCNPSIGGTAKGHLVREIDALGGEMGRVADKTFLQSRILNKGKGPAVYSLRAQSDRRAYQMEMKHRLELTENLDVKQAEIISIHCENGAVCGVVIHTGAYYAAKCVVLATGTFLKGKIIIGDVSYSGGPDGLFPADRLSDSLAAQGVALRRFKTGTPARVSRSSVDFSKIVMAFRFRICLETNWILSRLYPIINSRNASSTSSLFRNSVYIPSIFSLWIRNRSAPLSSRSSRPFFNSS